MHRIFFEMNFMMYCVAKLSGSQLKLKKVHFSESKPLFILSVNNNKKEYVKNDLIDIYLEFYSCLENFRFDHKFLHNFRNK